MRMLMLIAGVTFVGWVVDQARHVWPELGGGFAAYVLHQVYHVIWRRPGHWLVRLITRKDVEHH